MYVEEMHRLWCNAAVKMLRTIMQTEGLVKLKHAEKRAYIAKMREKKVQCPANTEGTPTTNRQRRMCKLAARLRELHNQLATKMTNTKKRAEMFLEMLKNKCSNFG